MAERSPKRMRYTIPSHDIPDDIMFSIFSKSTVKSLLRFRCISKSINAMIRSFTFIAAHHRNQIHDNNSNPNDTHLVYMPNDDREALRRYFILREMDALPHKYHKQCHLPFREFNLIGACEGLICLKKDSDLYILNPCVGSMKLVPPNGNKYDDVAYLFDFSERSCDYRVIKHVAKDKYPLSMILEIYSLATDSWRRIEHRVSGWSCDTRVQFLFDRSFCWKGESILGPEAEVVFLRFDLDEEIFEETTELLWCMKELDWLPAWTGRWLDVLEGNQKGSAIPLYHDPDWGYFRPQEYYLVPVKETLILFDQKDKNGLWIWDNISRRPKGGQIKDD